MRKCQHHVHRSHQHIVEPTAGIGRNEADRDASWQSFGVVGDQMAALFEDVRAIRSHPLIPETVAVGGFMYYVDTGLIDQKV